MTGPRVSRGAPRAASSARISAEGKSELRTRLVSCARDNPDLTSKNLAERFGVSKCSAALWLKEAGLARRAGARSPIVTCG